MALWTFGGGILTSAGAADVFIAKFDAGRNHLWSKRRGMRTISMWAALPLNSSGDAFLTGWFAGTLDFGGCAAGGRGGHDVFVVKFDGCSSNHLWSKRLGDADNQYADGIAVDDLGNMVVAGIIYGSADLEAGCARTPARSMSSSRSSMDAATIAGASASEVPTSKPRKRLPWIG